MEKKNPVQFLTDQLAAITLRLIDTEKQLEQEKKMSGEWYQAWQQKKTQLRETEARLAATNAEHRKLRDDLRAFIDQWSDKQIGAENCRTLSALAKQFITPEEERAADDTHTVRSSDVMMGTFFKNDEFFKGGKSDA